MRVLYILHASGMGGATISFLKMTEGLKQKGYDIFIILPSKDKLFEKEVGHIANKVFVLPLVNSIYPKAESIISIIVFYFLLFPRIIVMTHRRRKSMKALRTLINEIRPDIIHTNTGIVHVGYLCAKEKKIPHVWHLREYQDYDFNWYIMPSKRFYEKQLEKSYVVSITKDILNHFDLVESQKHRVIYNGIFRKDETALLYPKERYFLCASRVSPSKGIKDVIITFSKVHPFLPDYKLKILGFGEEQYIKEMKILCEQLKCRESVIFEGYHNNVRPFMEKAIALIVASNCEGFGRMTAEAAFCGCLVIGRNKGGTKEILEETGGLLFDDNEELGRCMINVAEMNDHNYLDLVKKAQKRAVELYSVEKNVEVIDQFYKYIISNERK